MTKGLWILALFTSYKFYSQSKDCGVYEKAPKTVSCQLVGYSNSSDTALAFLPDSCNDIVFDKNYSGIVKVLRPDRSVYGIYSVDSGTLNGPSVDYFPDGKIMTSVEFKNGSLNGAFKSFHPTGYPYYVGHYDRKGFSGKSFNYYWDNGRIAELMQWKNNSSRPDKDVKHWDKDGKEIDEQTFWNLWLDCD